jgi:DNA-binding FadR family transcriptional regulator
MLATPAAYVHEDVKFHDIIMRISGDRLSEAIINSIQGKALKNINYSGKLNAEHIRDTHAAHKQVYDAIMKRDIEGAARAMREHIQGSWKKRRPTSLK